MAKEQPNKTPAQLLKEAEKKSFAEEIELDKQQSEMLIRRGEAANKKLLGSRENSPVLEQEIESAAVYKRALIMLGSADMQIISESGTAVSASENNLPVSSYLSHGSRTVLQIPAGSNDDLINWLTSGDKERDGKSRTQSPGGAMSEGKYVYNRSAATHDVSVRDTGNGEKKVIETKGLLIGVRDFFANKLLRRDTKHWGVDLAVGAALDGKDNEGKLVTKPDGDHGHLYIHYTPATEHSPGSIMIGLEGAAPRSSKHSKLGASDPMSPSGGSKFGDLALKHGLAGEEAYARTVVPKKYNGIYANLDKSKIDGITNLKDKDFSAELAKAIPSQSSEDFVINKDKSHAKPNYQATKAVNQPKKPSLVHRIANKITFGYAYKTELKKYKENKKLFKTQTSISSKDTDRTNLDNNMLTLGSTKQMPPLSPDLKKTLRQNSIANPIVNAKPPAVKSMRRHSI